MSYASTVLGDSPQWYFRMNERGGPFARSIGADQSVGLTAGIPPSTNTSVLNVTPGFTGIAQDGGSFLLAYDGGMYVSGSQPAATTTFTFELWLAVATPTYGGLGQARRLIGLSNEPAPTFISLYDLHGNLSIQVQDSSAANHTNTYQATPGYLSDGLFHHVVLAVGPTTTVFYVDGAAASPSLTLTPASWDFNPAEHGIEISLGQYQPTSTTRGAVFYSEFAFYRSALSAGQVSAHYAAHELSILPRYNQGLVGVCQ